MARKTASTNRADEYSADQLTHLKGLDGVRKRPAMYIGSVDSRGLTHCVIEIADNSIDEAIAGHASRVDVTLAADGTVTVTDDGRGIPVGIVPGEGVPGVVLVYTELHAGGKFGDGGYKVSGGLHGVGGSVVNALSSRVDITVARDGYEWHIGFADGNPGQYDTKGKFTPGTDVRKGAKTKAHGTTVRFQLNREVFHPDATFDVDRIRKRLLHAAHLVDGLTTTLTLPDGTVETFNAPNGLAGLVEELDPAAQWLSPAVRVTGTGEFVERAAVLDDGKMVNKEVTRSCEVDIVLRWAAATDYVVESFVNTVTTPRGGTHVTGAERAVVRTLSGAFEGTRILKASEDAPGKDDILSGLRAVVSVRVPEPQFEGQTKDALANTGVTKVVADVVTSVFGPQVSASKSRAWVRAVLTQAAESARARANARAARELTKRKTALGSSSLPDKLKDCLNRTAAGTELLIIEGDSAGGTVGGARDSSFQAYLPIRGKILNVHRTTEAKMLANSECVALVTAIGGGVGREFNLDNARYERVIILCDADVDGSHIRSLLLTFFWRYMRPLVEAGRVYAAVPPLYRITLSRTGEYVYTYTEAEHTATLAKLKQDGVSWRDDIQRYKGLGEMDAQQLAETTLEPETRKLRRVRPGEAKEAMEMFDICMGDDAALRRAFIEERSDGYNLDLLDV